MKAENQTAVAKTIGPSKSYLRQIVKPEGNKPFGDTLAVRVEDGSSQSYGWTDESMMDVLHEWPQEFDDQLAEFVIIPRFRAEASMGSGAECPPEDEITGHLTFKNVWLQKRRLNPKFLTIIDAVGDSMVPTIHDGDILLVDLRQKDPIDNRIFVVRMNQQLYAKRVKVRPGSKLSLHSDNPKSPPFDAETAEHGGLEIIGQVVWAGKDLQSPSPCHA